MGFAPIDKDTGINLDLWDGDRWELSGPKDWPSLLQVLFEFLPKGSMLRFEGGCPEGDLREFLEERQDGVVGKHKRKGGVLGIRWGSEVFHVPATRENLSQLCELSKGCSEPELAVHFHVYWDGQVLLDWYDAFSDPICLSTHYPLRTP